MHNKRHADFNADRIHTKTFVGVGGHNFKCNITSNLVIAYLQLLLVYCFCSLDGYFLFDCIDQEKTSNNNTYKCLTAYRGSYTSAHVLLNLLNELGEVIKCEACLAFYHLFATT